MSHSPRETPTDAAQFTRTPYHQQLKHLDDLINRGGSLSGNERNCAFLNLGLRSGHLARFATISSVAGIDFPDDGRAWALTDWDGDGDVDAWVANRTAPRIRYLQNVQAAGNQAITLQLVGQSCNRDAVGARIDIRLKGVEHPILRVVRAGDGFLSQSTRTQVIGLGADPQIETLTVHWPGGVAEQFAGCRAGGRFRLEQGAGQASALPNLQARLPELARDKPSSPLTRDVPATLAVPLTSRISLPPLPLELLDGTRCQLSDLAKNQPVLVNLWATWCLPCRQELHDLAAWQHPDLQIVALATDGLVADVAEDPAGAALASPSTNPAAVGTREQPHDLVRSIAEEFTGQLQIGLATPALINRLQAADDLLFAQKRPLGVPTSFLIDQQQRLVAVFRGPVDLSAFPALAARLLDAAVDRGAAALPFPGRWFRARVEPIPLRLASQLAAAGDFHDAAAYLRANQQQFARQPGFATLAGQVASRLSQEQPNRDAIALYRAAASAAPRNVAILNNLAWQLATLADGTPEERREAVTWARRAVEHSQRGSASTLDTLATAYAAAGDRQSAAAAWREARQLARETSDRALLEKIDRALRAVEAE